MSTYYYCDEIIKMVNARMDEEKLTQKDMAGLIGISESFLSDILAKRRDPGIKLLDFFNLEKQIIYVVKQMVSKGSVDNGRKEPEANG